MSEKEAESLSNIDLLSDLKAAQLRDLEKACSFKHYSTHEQIIDRQSDSTDVFFVVAGKVWGIHPGLYGLSINLAIAVSRRHGNGSMTASRVMTVGWHPSRTTSTRSGASRASLRIRLT